MESKLIQVCVQGYQLYYNVFDLAVADLDAVVQRAFDVGVDKVGISTCTVSILVVKCNCLYIHADCSNRWKS